MPGLLHHGKRLHALTFNKPSKFKCIWDQGAGWQESQAVKWEGKERKKERKSFSWDEGTRGHPEMSLACPVNSWASFPSFSQCEGLRVRNRKLPPGRWEGWTPHLLNLVARIPFHLWQKRRKEGEDALCGPDFTCFKAINLSAFLFLCFFSFSFFFFFSLLSWPKCSLTRSAS